ncbi:unnamed protein product [Caenorhabditis angaria]|uniref:Serpentine receptor class r-10 n=1 Tax=Caenorhabditis angaria TaxID=860376 RepID=A0A9P1IWE0_9PELO|nr:unnamed protein product [Caenorhabditis angaria]
MFLIKTKSKNKFGSYKYLMFCFALFSIWYAFIDFITQPAMHSYKNSYIVLCATTYCTSYGLTLVLLAIHFVYRYFAIKSFKIVKHFQFPYLLIWPSIFLIIAVIWWLDVYFFLSSNVLIDEYMRKTIKLHYEDDIEKLSYIGPLYFTYDTNGKKLIQWKSCLGMLCVAIISIVTLTIIIVLGTVIRNTKKNLNNSTASLKVRKQLDKALRLQTIVPICFMYSPTTILFIAPIFGVELGSMANITSICLALYPVIDPLVVMFIIQDYREYIINKLQSKRNSPIICTGINAFPI